MDKRYFYETDGFSLLLDFEGDSLTRISFGMGKGLPRLPDGLSRDFLEAYFHGEEETPFPKAGLTGTTFELDVWRSLLKIPRGHLMTYASFAEMAFGSRKYARAVGQALGKNPLPILYPCHRVVASDLSLGGYAFGTDIKKALLLREGALFKGEKVVPGEGTFLP